MRDAKKQLVFCPIVCLLLWSVLSVQALAATRIAILDFDLADMTLAPRIPSEIKRTARIKPLLEGELGKAGYIIMPVDPALYKNAEQGVGYLFEHHDAAAALGKQLGADYVLVGRLHKPSFLFIYLLGHLVRVVDAQLIGDFVSEIKGSDAKLTLKGVENMTVKIDAVLDNRYTPPPPVRK